MTLPPEPVVAIPARPLTEWIHALPVAVAIVLLEDAEALTADTAVRCFTHPDLPRDIALAPTRREGPVGWRARASGALTAADLDLLIGQQLPTGTARNPHLTGEQAQLLTAVPLGGSTAAAIEVVGNPHVPAGIAERAARRYDVYHQTSPAMKAAIIGRTDITFAQAERHAGGRHTVAATCAEALLRRPDAPVDRLIDAARNHYELRVAARHPALPQDCIRELVVRASPAVLELLAVNPADLPDDVAHHMAVRLLGHPDRLRTLVTGRPLPADTLHMLASWETTNVRAVAAAAHTLPAAMSDQLAADPDVLVRAAVARRGDLPGPLHRQLADDPHATVIAAARTSRRRHTATDIALLADTLGDDQGRWAAALRILTGSPHLPAPDLIAATQAATGPRTR